MYFETHKAGVRHFFIAIGQALLLSFIVLVIKFFSQPIPLIGDIASICLFSWLVYLVFTHYAVVFEYRIEKKNVIITRVAGHRRNIISFSLKDVTDVSGKRPAGVRVKKRCVAMLRGKNSRYISHGSDAVLVDADDEFYEMVCGAAGIEQ